MDDFVYEISEDTDLLIECLQEEVEEKNNLAICDVGFGNGKLLLSLLDLDSNFKLFGSDINEIAISSLKNKLQRIGADKSISISNEPFLQGFKNLKFEYIVFNPPYLPSEKLDKHLSINEKKALVGGKKGVETTLSFLEEARMHLKETSTILVIVSSLANTSYLNQQILNLGYRYEIVNKISFEFESIMCYKLVPGEALRYSLKHNSYPVYLSKGSRSYVYELNSNSNIVLKQGISDMSANLQKEYEILNLLKDVMRVPKPYELLENLLVMEKIRGTRADKHSERILIAKFLVDAAVVLDTLNMFKKEFSRPFTNLIVMENNEICLIDFERAIIGKRGNLNQLCEFLKRQKIINEDMAVELRKYNDAFSEGFNNEFENLANEKTEEKNLSKKVNYFINYYGKKRAEAKLFFSEMISK